MPAQIFITKEQIAEMHDLGEDVVVLEGPMPVDPEYKGNTLDIWVLDNESLGGNTHRSVVLDPEGNVLGDERLSDDN